MKAIIRDLGKDSSDNTDADTRIDKRVDAIESMFKGIFNRTETTFEFLSEGKNITVIRTSLGYKASFNKDGDFVFETEYFPIAAIYCSYLRSVGIKYHIVLSDEIYCCGNSEDCLEIYPCTAPDTKVSKESLGIDDADMINTYYTLELKLNNSSLQNALTTPTMIKTAFVGIGLTYQNSTETKHKFKRIHKNDIASIKFTKLGMETIIEVVNSYKQLLTTSFENIEEALEEQEFLLKK